MNLYLWKNAKRVRLLDKILYFMTKSSYPNRFLNPVFILLLVLMLLCASFYLGILVQKCLFFQIRRSKNWILEKWIYRRLSRCKQLGGLVPVFRLGVPLRYKASKLWYPLKIPLLYKCYKSVQRFRVTCLFTGNYS